MSDPLRCVLTIRCPDRAGIAAAVFSFISGEHGFITEAAQYGDPDSDRFFMRIVFTLNGGRSSLGAFKEAFQPLVDTYDMLWQLYDADRPLRVMIAVSRFGHCLNDMLHRYASDTLPIDVPLIVSNHPDMEKMANWYDIPYHHLPVDPSNPEESKAENERKILSLFDENKIDLLVLARYMQILSPDLCAALKGRCINIHHSFLPSFKGARPYQRAHDHGVKLIGATAHYVTDTLDEGPIIEQAVERVDHTHTVDNLVGIGRDIENVVLARAVSYHAQHKVLLNGKRTVVFR